MTQQNIAKLVNLDDHINWIARTPAFITINDPKTGFQQNLSCWLINPVKIKIDKVSKLIIQKINKKLILELDFNQWKNNSSVLKWFVDISNKKDSLFMQLGTREFYPSINEDILKMSSSLKKIIDDEDLRLIMHCNQSLLFFGNESCFYVTWAVWWWWDMWIVGLFFNQT